MGHSRRFHNATSAGKEIGVSARWFAKMAAALHIQPLRFAKRHLFYTREQVERVRESRK